MIPTKGFSPLVSGCWKQQRNSLLFLSEYHLWRLQPVPEPVSVTWLSTGRLRTRLRNPLGDHVFKTKLGYTRFWDTHDSPWHERIYWIKSAKNHPDIEITGTLFPATFSHNMNQLSKQNAPKRVRQYITPLDVPITYRVIALLES